MGGKLTSESKHKEGPPITCKNNKEPEIEGKEMTMEGLHNTRGIRGVNMEALLNARVAMEEMVTAKAAAMKKLTKTATENDETVVREVVKVARGWVPPNQRVNSETRTDICLPGCACARYEERKRKKL
jgi:hypothetical protein